MWPKNLDALVKEKDSHDEEASRTITTRKKFEYLIFEDDVRKIQETINKALMVKL